MPDTPLYEPDEDENYVRIKRANINALEAKAAKADEHETRATRAERGLAFAQAGINLADPKLSYFVKGYDGDLTPEAIKTAATEAGFLAAPETVTAEAQTSAEAAARVTAAAAGATPPSNEADRQQKYAEAFKQAAETGEWAGFDATVSQYGPVVGINL